MFSILIYLIKSYLKEPLLLTNAMCLLSGLHQNDLYLDWRLRISSIYTQLAYPFKISALPSFVSLVSFLVDRHSFYDHLKVQYMQELHREHAQMPEQMKSG